MGSGKIAAEPSDLGHVNGTSGMLLFMLIRFDPIHSDVLHRARSHFGIGVGIKLFNPSRTDIMNLLPENFGPAREPIQFLTYVGQL